VQNFQAYLLHKLTAATGTTHPHISDDSRMFMTRRK